jgi:riboflavin synthase
MFTGIVDHCGKIQSIAREMQQALLWIRTDFQDLQLGESIAVDGVCLTVTAIKPGAFACELSPETWQLTIAQHYQLNDVVNLERALRLSDRVGGHFVSGHVDQIVTVAHIKPQQQCLEVHFTGVTNAHRPYLNPKGSVTINGVSLTINVITDHYFSVMLIPHTLNRTQLQALKVGQFVNIEFDLLAKMVGQQCQAHLTQEKISA